MFQYATRTSRRLIAALCLSLFGAPQFAAGAVITFEEVSLGRGAGQWVSEIGEVSFALQYCNCNSNFRDQYGLPPKDVRIAMLNLQLPETLADRMVRPVAVAEPGGS
jgi:hypothetical protein